MARSRRCCCCQDFYGRPGSGPARYKVESGAATRTLGADVVGNLRCFDFENSHVYFLGTGSAIRTIYRFDKDLSNLTVAKTLDSAWQMDSVAGLAVHPGNRHIYYGARPFPLTTSAYLRRCDFDGGNDIELLSFSDANPLSINTPSIQNIVVSKAEELVFYSRQQDTAADGLTPDIRRCNADGSGDMQLWDTATEGLQTRSMAIDNVGKFVFWSDGSNDFWRVGFGGGVTQIFDSPTQFPGYSSSFAMRLAGWSHRNERLYFWAGRTSGEANAGFYSVQRDGSDLRAECVYPKSVDSGFQLVRLGCGYDETGPGTKAS